MKAVALDLDGTLLNSKHNVSSLTEQVLNKLNHSGIKIILASARPIRSVLQIASKIGLNNMAMIGGNGAIIAKNENEILYRNSILNSDFQKIISFVKNYLINNPKNDFTMHIYSDFKWLVPFYTEKAKIEESIIGFKADLIGDKCFEANEPEKIMFVAHPDYLKKFSSEIKHKIPHLGVVLSKSDSLEINATGVSKYSGVVEYARLYNLDIKEFIAMGDGDNDEQMLVHCGYGVAMANGSEIAKKAAKEVTLSNDEDGVAKFLEKYFCLN